MKKVLIAVLAIALVGGGIVFCQTNKLNTENRKQNLKADFADLCKITLDAEIEKGTITKENADKVQSCVVQKEFANIDADKPSGSIQLQIIECLKTMSQNK